MRTVDERPNKGCLANLTPHVEVGHVSFSYTGIEQELENVDIRIFPGETVSLVGPSGCGKSTLLRLIAGVLKPTSGRVFIRGSEVAAPVNSIGFVPQDALLFPWRTVLGNVTLPLELAGMGKKPAVSAARKALEMANLEGIEAKYPHQLSGGMKQRVAIARALVRQTELLLLDEPFSSVDAVTRADLHSELRRIKELTHATVVLVTHNLIEAVLLSDRIFVLGERPGRLLDVVNVDLPYPRDPQMASFQVNVSAVMKTLVKGGITGGI